MSMQAIRIPAELSISSLAAELQASGLAPMGQDPDDVVGVLLFLSDLHQRLADGSGDGTSPILPGLTSARLEELEGTRTVGAGTFEDIDLEAPSNVEIVQLFEIVGDSDLTDFTVEIFEDKVRTRLNRVYRNANTTTNQFVDRLLEGQQYQDRDAGDGQPDSLYVRVTNNTAGPGDITARVKFRTERTQL